MSRKIYIASKTKHAEKWVLLRKTGANIISTWIDEAGLGQTKNMHDLCERCIIESLSCDAMIVYSGSGDILRGALIELGIALSRPTVDIYLVGDVLVPNSAFTYSPQIKLAKTVAEAIQEINYPKTVEPDTLNDFIVTNSKIKVTMGMLKKEDLLRSAYIGVPNDPLDMDKGQSWTALYYMNSASFDKIEQYFINKKKS